MTSKLLWSGGALLALLALAEAAARVFLGLGDPLLYVGDPQIEYMMKPNQDVTRVGNRIRVNQYGMRSEPFPPQKSSADELRVLLIGDSILNGGNPSDQQELAATQLTGRLERSTARPVVVGNASAGSWGPPNMLAYTRKFGFLDADVMVVVLSSHDASDVPTFAPLDPTAYPTVKPFSAVQEGLMTYLPRYLPWWRQSAAKDKTFPERRPPNDVALDAFRQLVQAGQSAGACVALIQHAAEAELSDGLGPGYSALKSVAEQLGIEHLQDTQALAESVRSGAAPYRDGLHPSARGQQILAALLEQAVLECNASDNQSRQPTLSAVR